ncbi:hypothetical protein Tco_0469013 [Tanacetum coccineum]
MKDIFDSTKSDLSATWKQNELLKDQLLEARLKNYIECCVLLSHECVDNNMQDEIEKVQRDYIEIQDGMQKWINILENDVQRCQKQSLDFELQLQHEKEKRKCESSMKNVCETSWISKIENLEREINELIENVKQKTYAYVDVRAQNQDLLIQVSELKANLKNVEKGLSDTSSVRRPLNRDSSFKTTKNVLCVTCAKNMLIPCHDNYLAKYKLNVRLKVRRALFTNPRTGKSIFKATTQVVSKTRFFVRTVQSKSTDTTPVVSKAKIDADTPLSAKNKIVDSGCSKHMTGDRSLLTNSIEKFIGTVRFRNDNFSAITGYGDYVQGNITVCHVYYVEGLGHNLFSLGQFCNGDLKVSFRSNTCYVHNLEGDDFLTGDLESNLYTISISDMAASSPVCLLSKATSTKSWLWHP